jgi:hypothetical protein
MPRLHKEWSYICPGTYHTVEWAQAIMSGKESHQRVQLPGGRGGKIMTLRAVARLKKG